MHVDDMAAACVKIMEELNMTDLVTRHTSHVTFLNIGTGVDQTIQELAMIIKKIIGFKGEIGFDPAKADGTYKKLLDVSGLKTLGFIPSYTLEKGIKQVYGKYSGD